MIKKITSLLLATVTLAGCASRASSIAPVAVPSSNYAGMTCDEARIQLEQKQAAQNTLTRQQNNAATGDAVGVFLFLLPVGSIFGADKAGELAQVKGEVMALQGAVTISCRR